MFVGCRAKPLNAAPIEIHSGAFERPGQFARMPRLIGSLPYPFRPAIFASSRMIPSVPSSRPLISSKS